MTEDILLSILIFLVGIVMLIVGIRNVKNQNAEESGKRRIINKLFGGSNQYTGKKAVMIGWVRIIIGLFFIAFSIFSLLKE